MASIMNLRRVAYLWTSSVVLQHPALLHRCARRLHSHCLVGDCPCVQRVGRVLPGSMARSRIGHASNLNSGSNSASSRSASTTAARAPPDISPVSATSVAMDDASLAADQAGSESSNSRVAAALKALREKRQTESSASAASAGWGVLQGARKSSQQTAAEAAVQTEATDTMDHGSVSAEDDASAEEISDDTSTRIAKRKRVALQQMVQRSLIRSLLPSIMLDVAAASNVWHSRCTIKLHCILSLNSDLADVVIEQAQACSRSIAVGKTSSGAAGYTFTSVWYASLACRMQCTWS